jgi:hypothetical protein
VDMYTYMHMSVDQPGTKITVIYATVTTYETYGQSTISIKTKSGRLGIFGFSDMRAGG